jgi:hypothetical protein
MEVTLYRSYQISVQEKHVTAAVSATIIAKAKPLASYHRVPVPLVYRY